MIETHYITIDATTCMQLTGSPVVRNLTEVKGTSNNSWSLRCPIELPDATNSSVTITGLTAFARCAVPCRGQDRLFFRRICHYICGAGFVRLWR